MFFCSLKPTIRSKSTVEDVKRCTTKTADLAGNFNVTEARLTVEAFGMSIWLVSVMPYASSNALSKVY